MTSIDAADSPILAVSLAITEIGGLCSSVRGTSSQEIIEISSPTFKFFCLIALRTPSSNRFPPQIIAEGGSGLSSNEFVTHMPSSGV